MLIIKINESCDDRMVGFPFRYLMFIQSFLDRFGNYHLFQFTSILIICQLVHLFTNIHRIDVYILYSKINGLKCIFTKIDKDTFIYSTMAKYGENLWTVQFPEGTVEDINRMMKVERRWMNVQEFIRDAVNEKIERWKKEHPPKG